jgi:hypothetical protein
MTVDEKGYDAESHPIKDRSLLSQGCEIPQNVPLKPGLLTGRNQERIFIFRRLFGRLNARTYRWCWKWDFFANQYDFVTLCHVGVHFTQIGGFYSLKIAWKFLLHYFWSPRIWFVKFSLSNTATDKNHTLINQEKMGVHKHLLTFVPSLDLAMPKGRL